MFCHFFFKDHQILYIQNSGRVIVIVHVRAGPGVGVVNGQPLPSTQYTRAPPALPGGGGVDVGNVGMKDSAVGPCPPRSIIFIYT